MAERAVKMSGVSGAVEQLILQMSSTLGIPIVFDPDTNYENCVKCYRNQVEDDYHDQDRTNDFVATTIIGWRRSPLRRGRFGKRSTSEHCIPELDRQGNKTGGTVKFCELQSEYDLDFTIYTKDLDVIEDFEIQYLSGYSIRKFKHIELMLEDNEDTGKSYVDLTNSVWRQSLTWDDDIGEISFVRDDNQYCSLDFRAKVAGSFFSRIDGGVNPRIIYKIAHETVVN